MNTDIRIAVSFKGHRKRKKLELLLGPKAVLALIDLWISSAMNHPDGKLVAMDELDIALEAGWEGDAEEFVGALVGVKFLDKTEDGTYELHDWPEHQHWVIGAKERSVRARKAAEARWANRYSEQSGERARSMLAASPEHIDRNAPFLSSPIQKREVDKSSSSESFSPPYEEIKNAWNTTVSRLPQLKAISEKRKRVIDKLWLKFPDLEIWKLIFKKADNNDFLTDNQTYIKKNSYEGWKADFDYITREEVFMRIYEGSFDG